jgi:hypothetical protein
MISSAFLALDYFVQLTVVQPSLVKGQTSGLSLISQYNPHGLFIALEALGYLLMSLVFLFSAPVFAGHGGLGRVLRWVLVTAFVLTLGALLVLWVAYGNDLEYRFEVAAILIDWLALIAVGILLGVVFRRAGRPQQ